MTLLANLTELCLILAHVFLCWIPYATYGMLHSVFLNQTLMLKLIYGDGYLRGVCHSERNILTVKYHFSTILQLIKHSFELHKTKVK